MTTVDNPEDPRVIEDDDLFACRGMLAMTQIEATVADLASWKLAAMSGEPTRDWADRIYDRLEAMPTNDLALMVVLACEAAADHEADVVWSSIHALSGKDLQ